MGAEITFGEPTGRELAVDIVVPVSIDWQHTQ